MRKGEVMAGMKKRRREEKARGEWSDDDYSDDAVTDDEEVEPGRARQNRAHYSSPRGSAEGTEDNGALPDYGN